MCCILHRLRARHAEACQRDAGFHRRRELKALQEYNQNNNMRRPYDLEEDMPPRSCKQRLSRLVSHIRRARRTEEVPYSPPMPSMASLQTISQNDTEGAGNMISLPQNSVGDERVARHIMLDELEEHFALHQEGTPEQWALYNELIRIEESLSFFHDHQTHVVPPEQIERSQERRNGRAALPKFIKAGVAKPDEFEQYAEEEFMMSGAIVWKQDVRKASVVSVEDYSSDEFEGKAKLEGATEAV